MIVGDVVIVGSADRCEIAVGGSSMRVVEECCELGYTYRSRKLAVRLTPPPFTPSPLAPLSPTTITLSPHVFPGCTRRKKLWDSRPWPTSAYTPPKRKGLA